MLRITGYSDKYTAFPGEEIKFYVNAEKNENYEVQIVRLIHGDTNPEGPGYKDEDGIIERKNLLEKNGFSRTFIKKNLFKKDNFYKQDDFLDACSLFWSANRVALNKEIRIPNNKIVDTDGIVMQIRV